MDAETLARTGQKWELVMNIDERYLRFVHVGIIYMLERKSFAQLAKIVSSYILYQLV
jgi:hypothetical protein